jgi:hypothetical protein
LQIIFQTIHKEEPAVEQEVSFEKQRCACLQPAAQTTELRDYKHKSKII